MGRFSNYFMLEHDMDIFCSMDNKPIHIATRGTLLPEEINDKERQLAIWLEVQGLEPIEGNEVHINENFLMDSEIQEKYEEVKRVRNLENIIEQIGIDMPQEYSSEIKLYCHTFYFYAQRGFYSFYYSPERESFFCVAYPSVTYPDIETLPKLEKDFNLDFSHPENLTDVKLF